jgi:DNA-3-methyladenine glycosylase
VKLEKDFYSRPDVIEISKDLLGKYLFTKKDGKITAGIITETEAYEGVTDKASHAYNYRRTKRNEIMYGDAGKSYVYICYGIHHLFNITTNKKDIPHAILIRAMKPAEGIKTMLERRRQTEVSKTTAGGPGTLSQALGITILDNATDLSGNKIWLEDHGIQVRKNEIITGPRIGVEYAKEAALFPYRFRINL